MKILLCLGLLVTGAASATTNCSGFVFNKATERVRTLPLIKNSEGLYRAEIDGFEFGADMNPAGVSPGGGIFHPATGFRTFAQANKDGAGGLKVFYLNTEVMNHVVELYCLN